MKIEFQITDEEVNHIEEILCNFTNFEVTFLKEDLEKFIKNLPKSILLDGLKFGFSDTEFRENVLSNLEIRKSLNYSLI